MDKVIKTTSPNLKLSFPNATVTTPGPKLSKQDSRPAPTLFLKLPTPSKTYFSISLDPDAPFPSFPFLGPVLHTLQTDLTAQGEADGEGWVKLSGSGKPLAPWVRPGPPGISAPHRYVFLVWEQPEGLTEERIRKEMGWGEQVGLMARMRWNQSGFEGRFGLGDVVGGNWFVCG